MDGQQVVATFLLQSDNFRDRRNEFYRPLDTDRLHIRLMHIQPTPFENDLIHVTVSEADLSEKPEYECLSYTWGDVQTTAEILIHDIPYNVTLNQYAALRRLRRVDQVRTMWMDVVCIDQANIEERSHQVSIMGNIYASSVNTIVWLAEVEMDWVQGITDQEWDKGVYGRWWRAEFPHSDDRWGIASGRRFGGVKRDKDPNLTEVFQDLQEKPKGIFRGARQILELFAQTHHFCDMPSYEVANGDEVFYHRPWFDCMKLLYHLLSQSWWSRVWVLQEVLLCKGQAVVMFSDEQLPLSLFIAASHGFFTQVVHCQCCIYSLTDILLRDWVDPLTQAMSTIKRLDDFVQIEPVGQMSLHTAASLTALRKATDIRDFIYGILGLVKPRHRIKVNYRLTVAEVFAKVTFESCRLYDELKLLGEGGLIPEFRILDLPTWSVNWTKFRQGRFGFEWTFETDENEIPDWSRVHFDSATGTLQVLANKLNTVRAVFETRHLPDGGSRDPRVVKSLFMHWKEQLLQFDYEVDLDHHEMKSETISERAKELFITVFRDTRFFKPNEQQKGSNVVCGRFGPTELEDLVRWWVGLNKIVDRLENARDDAQLLTAYPREFPSYLTEPIRDRLKNYALALTVNGKLCMVPAVTEPGDEVFHVRSCSAPLVLRSTQNHVTAHVAENCTSHFQNVGPAFLHGTMGSAGWRIGDEEVITLH